MIFFLKLNGHFYPASKQDEEICQKIPPATLIKCEYVKGRNYQNLQRLHVLFHILWENMDNDWQKYFGTIDNFRYSVEWDAAIIDIFPTMDGKKIRRLKSISYESMKTEEEFRDAFSKIIDSLLKYFEKWTKKEMIKSVENEIINFI